MARPVLVALPFVVSCPGSLRVSPPWLLSFSIVVSRISALVHAGGSSLGAVTSLHDCKGLCRFSWGTLLLVLHGRFSASGPFFSIVLIIA